jgi:hypothetical protein
MSDAARSLAEMAEALKTSTNAQKSAEELAATAEELSTNAEELKASSQQISTCHRTDQQGGERPGQGGGSLQRPGRRCGMPPKAWETAPN